MASPPLHQLVVRPDPQAAAAAAAEAIAKELSASVDLRGSATLAVSGGSGAAVLFDELVRRRRTAPWARIHVLQVDERSAPDGHPDRNATTLQRHLTGPLGLRPSQVHLVAAGSMDAPAAALAYQATVTELEEQNGGRLDVVHLGLGDDGHTASLVPDDPALDELAAPATSTLSYRGRTRVTLTYPTLDAARTLVWFAIGTAKAEVVRLLLAGDPSIPAGRVRPSGTSTVIVDVAAAAGVS